MPCVDQTSVSLPRLNESIPRQCYFKMTLHWPTKNCTKKTGHQNCGAGSNIDKHSGYLIVSCHFIDIIGVFPQSAYKLQRCSLLWRHNEHDSVSNHQPHDCLLKPLFGRRWKKTSKLRTNGQQSGECFHLMTSSCFVFLDAASCPVLQQPGYVQRSSAKRYTLVSAGRKWVILYNVTRGLYYSIFLFKSMLVNRGFTKWLPICCENGGNKSKPRFENSC